MNADTRTSAEGTNACVRGIDGLGTTRDGRRPAGPRPFLRVRMPNTSRGAAKFKPPIRSRDGGLLTQVG
jgi:hypothetical protein